MARRKSRSCIIDGARLTDAAAVYRELGKGFGAPDYFGNNPDALWDLITEYGGAPVEIVWKNSAQSAARLGTAFEQIAAVLQRAEAEGRIKLRLE
ncbi:MAG: barstar family protein [Alphaproteobacteria bacterium]|nr:barstar family protein [Alphaproteobacteria bacterium]MBV9153195.1 barstar family protein [Alphaproteobacteria bacterium]MBV9583349.1 barstar family protein [Alphaproteobacteria bacterium]MBV9965695.1 barstar family protein [Alphaproteobacteria bacterium]